MKKYHTLTLEITYQEKEIRQVSQQQKVDRLEKKIKKKRKKRARGKVEQRRERSNMEKVVGFEVWHHQGHVEKKS